MNLAFLKLMSGPLAALLRYGVTAGGAVLARKGYLDDSAVQAVVGAGLAVIPAVIGALTSTVDAKIKTTALIPTVAGVVGTDGRATVDTGNGYVGVTSARDVLAYPGDATMNDPNAR